jgi:hypothetical protein
VLLGGRSGSGAAGGALSPTALRAASARPDGGREWSPPPQQYQQQYQQQQQQVGSSTGSLSPHSSSGVRWAADGRSPPQPHRPHSAAAGAVSPGGRGSVDSGSVGRESVGRGSVDSGSINSGWGHPPNSRPQSVRESGTGGGMRMGGTLPLSGERRASARCGAAAGGGGGGQLSLPPELHEPPSPKDRLRSNAHFKAGFARGMLRNM